MNLFKKNNTIDNPGTSFNRLLTCDLVDELDVHEQKFDFANAILGGCPILLNFNKVKDTRKCNLVLSFLLGVAYAVGGESYQIGDESYIIGNSEAFKDGSLHKWIKEFGHYDD